VHPVKGGVLEKQGKTFRGWSKRFFLLEGPRRARAARAARAARSLARAGKYLYYYASERDTEPRGVISLVECRVQEEHEERRPNCFALFALRGWNVQQKRDSRARKYVFCAEVSERAPRDPSTRGAPSRRDARSRPPT
jgi:hypothetical protein